MAITLNHTIVPARDKAAAAKFFGHIFGLKRGRTSYFAPVRVNKTLTLLFDDDGKFESHHYAFHVSEREFDAIFRRIQKAKVAYGSAAPPRDVPTALTEQAIKDYEVLSWNGLSVPASTRNRDRHAGERPQRRAARSLHPGKVEGARHGDARGTPAEMDKRMKDDIVKWGAVIEKAGIQKRD